MTRRIAIGPVPHPVGLAWQLPRITIPHSTVTPAGYVMFYGGGLGLVLLIVLMVLLFRRMA